MVLLLAFLGSAMSHFPVLCCACLELQRENAQLKKHNQELQTENQELRKQLDEALRSKHRQTSRFPIVLSFSPRKTRSIRCAARPTARLCHAFNALLTGGPPTKAASGIAESLARMARVLGQSSSKRAAGSTGPEPGGLDPQRTEQPHERPALVTAVRAWMGWTSARVHDAKLTG